MLSIFLNNAFGKTSVSLRLPPFAADRDSGFGAVHTAHGAKVNPATTSGLTSPPPLPPLYELNIFWVTLFLIPSVNIDLHRPL